MRNCQQSIQEFWDFVKRSNLGNVGVKKGAEIYTKRNENLFSEITAEYSSNLGKDISIQIQEAVKTQDRQDQEGTSYNIL